MDNLLLLEGNVEVDGQTLSLTPSDSSIVVGSSTEMLHTSTSPLTGETASCKPSHFAGSVRRNACEAKVQRDILGLWLLVFAFLL